MLSTRTVERKRFRSNLLKFQRAEWESRSGSRATNADLSYRSFDELLFRKSSLEYLSPCDWPRSKGIQATSSAILPVRSNGNRNSAVRFLATPILYSCIVYNHNRGHELSRPAFLLPGQKGTEVAVQAREKTHWAKKAKERQRGRKSENETDNAKESGVGKGGRNSGLAHLCARRRQLSFFGPQETIVDYFNLNTMFCSVSCRWLGGNRILLSLFFLYAPALCWWLSLIPLETSFFKHASPRVCAG